MATGALAIADLEPRIAVPGRDRRVHPRLRASELRGLVTARVKYGDQVRLIDLSVGGALIEATGRIAPDTTVVFELAGPGSTLLVPSRALRVNALTHLDDAGRYEGAFQFKRPIALNDLLREPAVACQKVIARYRDGRLLQGYTCDFSKQGLSISPTPFGDVSRLVPLSDLAFVFFMRDAALAGSERARPQGPQRLGRRVSVTLPDGEILVGTTLNYSKDGFFMHPLDSPDTMRVFVTPSALRSVRFL